VLGARRTVRSPRPGRAARVAGPYLRQDGGLAATEPAGDGDARLLELERGTEHLWPRARTHGASGAEQHKIARA